MCPMTRFTKYTTLFFILFFEIFTLNAQNAQNLSMIYKVLDLRLSTRLCNSPDEAILKIDSFKNTLEKEEAFTSLNSEEALIIENMLAQERYNYMYERNMTGSDLKPYILSQYDKINSYKDLNEGKSFSPWFVLTSGDVINSSMQFLPQATAIKQGLREKDEYDRVIKENTDMAFAYINSALWYYFAPAIGGGSKSLAKEYFQKAIDCSTCDYEAFYSRVYLSQLYFDEGDGQRAKRLLDQAEEILPGSNYVSFIRYLNTNNFSLMYYTNNREKVEKKLK